MSTVTGGLIYKPGGGNMQRVTALSFLVLAYANDLDHSSQLVSCGTIPITPARLRAAAKRQVWSIRMKISSPNIRPDFNVSIWVSRMLSTNLKKQSLRLSAIFYLEKIWLLSVLN